MSLVDEFYKRYDELTGKYKKITEVFKSQGAEKPAEVVKQISLSRRKKRDAVYYLFDFFRWIVR